MNIFNSFIILCILFLPFHVVSAKQRKHIIIPKAGIYEMDNTVTAGYRFDTKSNRVLGFEYEYHFTNGLTIGVEHMYFENSFVGNNLNRKLKVNVAFFDAKYYFNYKTGSHWLPYIGLGAGYAFGRDNDNSIDGLAYQIFAGIAYQWERFGVYVQYKQMDLEVESSFRFISPVTFNKYDLSGKGLFAGISIKF